MLILLLQIASLSLSLCLFLCLSSSGYTNPLMLLFDCVSKMRFSVDVGAITQSFHFSPGKKTFYVELLWGHYVIQR